MATESSPLLSNVSSGRQSHYLATSRGIILQATSLISAVDGLFGTYTLTLMKQRAVIASAYGATLDISGAFVAGLLLTMAGSIAGAACGILFLVLLLHPAHGETVARVIAKEVVLAFSAIFFLVASIISTVVVATGSATLYTPGMSEKKRQEILDKMGGSLAYRSFPTAIVFVVLGWTCWLVLTISLALVSRAGRHVLKHGAAHDAPKAFPERIADRVLYKWFGDRYTA